MHMNHTWFSMFETAHFLHSETCPLFFPLDQGFSTFSTMWPN